MYFKRLFCKKTYYDYVISLGYNCEVAFKFLKYFKFEESSLFNWCYINSINDLINALQNFDKIGSGQWQMCDLLWQCLNSNIKFHGKLPMSMYLENNVSEEEMKDDINELVSRLKYLKEKFLKIAQSENMKLFIYKMKTCEVDELFNIKILNIIKSLELLGVKNFKLMVVLEKQNINKINNISTEYLVEFVDYFTPDNDVTGKKYYKNGWSRVFNKISVINQNKKIKKKKYKFDIK